ncbi:MAG: DUF2270 domain-containing protein [Aridibacter famidurans]|nr:DUF2270 domain-containing protein [Aridibacter famidurans]
MSDPIHETEDAFVRSLRLHSDNPSLVSLTEEVRERKQKPKTDPTSIPQKLSLGEFNTAMVHFYRGELARSNTWRTRLDATTNWAVITAGATLSFVFSSPDNPHFAIPINSILVAIFLFMEARRYRYYEVWANRVRVLETGYFAPMLSYRTIPPDKEWAEHVSSDLINPHFTISEWEAIGRRLRSNYIWIFVLLALSWTLKVYLHPYPTPNLEVFLDRAAVGLAPGWLVITAGIVFNAIVFSFAIGTMKLNQASSEVQPHEESEWHPIQQVSKWADSRAKKRHTIRRAKRARQRTSSVIHKTNA